MDWTIQGWNPDRGKRFFFFLPLQNLHTGSGSDQASHSVGTGVSFHVAKWPVCEVDHSLPSSAEVRNEWSCTSTVPPSWCGQRKLLPFYYYL